MASQQQASMIFFWPSHRTRKTTGKRQQRNRHQTTNARNYTRIPQELRFVASHNNVGLRFDVGANRKRKQFAQRKAVERDSRAARIVQLDVLEVAVEQTRRVHDFGDFHRAACAREQAHERKRVQQQQI